MNGQNGHPVNFSEADGAAGAPDYDRARPGAGARRRAGGPRATGAIPTAPERSGFSVDPGSLLRPALRYWYWLFFGALAGALGGAMLGIYLWKTSYKATTQLMRYDTPISTEAYRPTPLNGRTLLGVLTSPEIGWSIGRKMNPPVPGGHISGRIKVVPERNSDIVTVEFSGSDPRSAVELAKLYNAAIIEFSQEHQRKEAQEASAYVDEQLRKVEADLEAARKDLPPGTLSALTMAPNGESSSGLLMADKLALDIQTAHTDLMKLLGKFTEQHPLVKQKRAEIEALEAQIPKLNAQPNAAAGGRSELPRISREEAEVLAFRIRTLETLRQEWIARQRAVEVFKANPPGMFRELQPPTMDAVGIQSPWVKIGLVSVFFSMIGIVLAGAEVLRREFFDNHLKTEADVTRVTGLPVLGTLGDLKQMSLAAREAWAFRTWIALQDRLAYSPNHGLICGITSSNPGEGRSTWIALLAGAARKCGFRVLTIATRPTADADLAAAEAAAEAAQEPVLAGAAASSANVNGAKTAATVNGATHTRSADAPSTGRTATLLARPNDLADSSRAFSGESEFTALTASALFTPAMVTEKLMGPETDPLVHIPLPGWTWKLERRKQWQGALNVWRKIDTVVILVELPPASMAESVLLASNLPNLAWLVESGKAEAAETRAQLQTLRHARCNLVGAFINRAMTSAKTGRFSRWVNCLALVAVLGASGAPLIAGEPAAPARGSFSVSAPQRAAWQQQLTLGPGDLLNLGIYGDPDYTLEEVPIGPDGRISYLEAREIMAAGLTVDQLRDRLNEELGKFRRAPQVIVVPVAYNSKKYFILGKVAQRGAFTLDRPMTLVEAVARAGGLETGIASDRSIVELPDLSRSFIARKGERLPVDFERLFHEGDLSQNVALEPNDYIYFPGGGEKEVYVLGAVSQPGAYYYNTQTGAVGAVAGRGGFSDRAWRKKLLVIRGGLGRPETLEVDATEVLSGRRPDLRLQPKDIVFVSDRPWIYAEELLDAAANAFVISAVVTWTGDKITRDR